MPGRLSGNKRRSSHFTDDDESADEHTPQQSASSKRARMNTHDEEDEESSDGPLLPESYRASQVNDTESTESGPQKHHPGSIVRVTLKNFVTYTNAEFFPGPSLNMIIGPNGTGKSTLVCAICLGLGWKTEHLGRAKNIGEFVKHGSKDAIIEIELAADPARHDTNPVIKHHIRKEGDKSAFFIDGKAAPRKDVMQLCKSFAIQVDNLCQFLPQDRVVEFAALSSEDLLSQTQRAAAPDYMVEWHEDLKKMRTAQKTAQNDRLTLAESLKNLESRQNMQRTDVDRLRERNDLQEQLTALQKYRPVPAYRIARTNWQSAKEKKKTAEEELAALQEEMNPSLEAAAGKKTYHEKIQEVVKTRKRVFDKTMERAQTLFKKQELLNGQIEDQNKEIEAENNGNKKYRAERARLEGLIRAVETRMQSQAPEFEPAEFNERLRELTRQMRDLEEKAREANNQQQDCVSQARQRQQRIGGLLKNIDDLHSQSGQQEKKLKVVSRDTYEAWDWIKNNPMQFESEVFGPPILSCTVKDQRHAAFVENMLSNAELCSFTTTNDADFEKLNHQLLSVKGWKDINIRICQTPLSEFRPPVPRDHLAGLGLDAYVVDLLDGPEPVLSMMCDNRNIHATGVSFHAMSNQQYEALTRSPISSFATPTETFIITRRREYGEAGTSTRTRRLREARFFTDQAVDTGAEQEFRNKIAELKDEMAELSRQVDAHKEISANAGSERRELKETHDELMAEKNLRQKAHAEFAALPVQKDNLTDKLTGIDTRQAEARDRLHECQKRIDVLVLERAQEALNYATAVNALQKLYTDLLEAELLSIEAQSDYEVLDARNAEINQLLTQRAAEVNELVKEVQAAKEAAQRYLSEVNKMIADRTDREEEIQKEQPDTQTPAELDNEIESLTARLEMVTGGDQQHILREFEERGIKIDRTRVKLETADQKLVDLETRITDIRGRWEPQLDELVRKISDAFGENFARIGCAGQVEVHKDDDFEKWSIQVMVKFREHESLSVLDSHRQSGGERAVSTIFYLMALQSLARAPFRVVDEINQGMDPKNERLVHSRIVNIACAEHTSQYFLITPKLLPNLTYHPSMKVHCIASGEYMPTDHKALDFNALAAKALGVKRKRTGGVVAA